MTDDRFKTGGALDALGALDDVEDNLVGRALGDYRILGLIAEGGMGRVYRAERIDGSFEREVAIKVSSVGGFSPSVRERFAAEQSILAGLNHPNISQLYDARVTVEGWPYIVMELVDGGPIDAYCNANQVSQEDRVSLIVQVVEAVAYAHARLVVHRDIKPSNVLVNADGRPKLLDFGIAKLLDSDEQGMTKAGLMTPRYASPEQLLGQPVTTASDIYQIGVLLFEVLTGALLHADASPSTAIQRAAEQKPVALDPVARARLPRDLLSIIERCLRVSPEERYADANALRGDLLAFLGGYPVSTAPLSWHYRLTKLVRRNQAASAFIAAATITVAASTIWYTIEVTRQRDAAEEQRRLADESLDFLSSFYRAANPDNAQGRTLTALDMLNEGAGRIGDELAEEPKIQSRLYFEVAETYRRLSQFEQALEMAELGLDATRTGYPDEPTASLNLRSLKASVFRQQGKPVEAAGMYREIIDIANRELGPGSDEAHRFRHNLAIAQWQSGETSEAIAQLRDLIAAKAERHGEGSRTTIISASVLVNFLQSSGALDESIELGEKYLAISQEALGELHSLTLDLGTNLALALGNRDGPDASIPLLEANAEANGVIHGRDSYEYWHRYALLVIAHIGAGRRDPWVDELRTVVAKMSALRGAEDSAVLTHRVTLAGALIDEQRASEAIPLLDEVLSVQRKVIGLDHPNAFYTQIVRARAELSADQADAMPRAGALLARATDVLGSEHVLTKMLRDAIASYE